MLCLPLMALILLIGSFCHRCLDLGLPNRRTHCACITNPERRDFTVVSIIDRFIV
jgi:hypothetical protein